MELAFIEKVAEWSGTTTDVAESLTLATLRTLTQRISAGEAADLADRAPEELRPFLIKAAEPPEVFPYAEFVGRVAEAAGVERPTAEVGIASVLRALRDVVGHRELMETLAQLPKDLTNLVVSQIEGR